MNGIVNLFYYLEIYGKRQRDVGAIRLRKGVIFTFSLVSKYSSISSRSWIFSECIHVHSWLVGRTGENADILFLLSFPRPLSPCYSSVFHFCLSHAGKEKLSLGCPWRCYQTRYLKLVKIPSGLMRISFYFDLTPTFVRVFSQLSKLALNKIDTAVVLWGLNND